MSGPTPNSGDIFDVRKIRRLVELMNEHGLNEIDLRNGETRVRLRRASEVMVAPIEARPAAPPHFIGGVSGVGASPTQNAGPPAETEFHVIKSPMVGTVYAASSPDAPAFVKIGDHVGPETTVCIVEAMKVFNEIPAEVSGKIVAILIENGEPVDFGQPLFKVDTRG